MKATQFDIFVGNGKVKEPSAKQAAALGSACVEALHRYHKSRTRISEEERAARKRIRTQKWTDEIRLEMVAAYGGKCLKCGESDPIVLLLDHINDDAKLDKKQHGHHGGWMMYRRLRKLGWPKDRYQLLCHNCNYRKELERRKRKRKCLQPQ
jgi:hypothetical protein